MSHLNRDTLNLYLDAQLSEAERLQAEAHLANCATCRAELNAQRELFGALDAWRDEPMPRDLTPTVMARVALERQSTRSTRLLALVLGAQALVAFAVALWLVLPRLEYLGAFVPAIDFMRWLTLGTALTETGLPIPLVPLGQAAAGLALLGLLWLVSNHLLLGRRNAREQERA